MSDEQQPEERGESYLEVQMDRWTIALAGLAVLALLVGAFFLGSWFGSRAKDDAPATAAAVEDDEAPLDAGDEDHDATEPVASEGAFGPGAVSARGAATLTEVPPPIADVEPVRATASRPPAGRSTAPKATAPKPTAPKPTAAKPPPPASAATGSGWIIQVAALEKQAEADQLRARLEKKGYPTRVVVDGQWYKVHVGPYSAKAEAQLVEQRLKREERVSTWLKPA